MNPSILLFAADAFEDLELMYPVLRLREAGFEPVVAGAEARATYKGKHGYPCRSDVALRGLRASDFAGLVIAGGWMPDQLRRDPGVLALTRAFDAEHKLVASICHGPWVCISAGIVRGRRYTSTPGIKDDLVNAGATWTDEPLVVDGHHVSSRRPDDLPQFMKGVFDVLGARTAVESRGR